MDKLVLIDGNSIAFRAFFALPLLSNSAGVYTNAVYGFTMMLMKVLEEEAPSHILVAFDAGKTTFRHDDYQEYKGKREKTPGEFSQQIPLIKEVLDAFGIRHFELEGFEADDIIGTLARQAERSDLDTLIVTGDKDLLQLVTDKVNLLLTRKGVTETERYDVEAVKERYGLKPEQIIDLKGLMGDPSDNIPGIPGVGEKTALKLLHQFGSVEAVLEHVDELPGKKLRERVAEHREQARLSKKLATIHCNVPLTFDLEDLKFVQYDRQRVLELFKRLAFQSLIDRLGETEETVDREDAQEIEVRIVHESDAQLNELLTQDRLACHVELSETNYHRADIIGVALSDGERHVYLPWETARQHDVLLSWLADSSKEKIGYDVKAATVALRRHGVQVTGFSFDILLASYLLNPSESAHELSDVVRRKLDGSLPDDESFYGKGQKRRQPDEDELAHHLARKTAAMVRLHPLLVEELDDARMMSLFSELEMPLSRVLADMECVGVKVDRERLEKLGEELKKQLDVLTQEIYDLAGTEFNINSPKQLGEILFDKMGLPVLKKTKTGYSTSADVLEKLAPQHEIVEKILHFRQVGKLISTYVEGLLKEIDPETGKIHTRFNQTITATGRLSSTEPNLQNIPIRLEEGRRIRQVFVPSEPDWLILSADYSQIELRVLAHLSGDENLKEAFVRDMDIHTKTAMDVFGVSEEEVTPLMRRHAKAVNFGIVYGISDYGLSQNLNISRKEAAEFIERYFASYPGVKAYMERVVEQAKQDGYVTTMLNRRRYLPDIRSRNYNLRSFAERTAMNTPIQGTAADIIKSAMVRMDEVLKEKGAQSRMLLQVHDELIFEVPASELDWMKKTVREVMEGTMALSVPLKVDVHHGPTWYQAK
jgi:DNA polymerase-1